MDKYSDGLYRFILKHINDADVARDIVQDSFEKMWRKVNEVDFIKSKSYLFTTGYHTLIDYTRRAKKQERINDTDESEQSHNVNYSDLKEILNKALDKLPEIQKTVILLRDYEGYDYSEIGTITHLTESQVKVYIFRGRQLLKNYLVSVQNVI